MAYRIEPRHHDAPASWPGQPVHQPQHRALAGTIIPNQTDAPLSKAKLGNGKNLTIPKPNLNVLKNDLCNGGRSGRIHSRRSAPHSGHAQNHQFVPYQIQVLIEKT